MKSPVHRMRAFALAAGLLLAPAVAFADVADDVHAAYAKALTARYEAKTVSTDESGKKATTTARFDSAERIHITTDQGGFIILPEGTWMQTGKDGPWQKPPFDMSGMLKQMLPKTMDDMRANAKNFRDEGTRTVDGVTLRAISYDYASKVMGIAVSTHVVVFLDADGRVVRSESDAVAMGRKTHSVQTLHYDDGIRVSAP